LVSEIQAFTKITQLYPVLQKQNAILLVDFVVSIRKYITIQLFFKNITLAK